MFLLNRESFAMLGDLNIAEPGALIRCNLACAGCGKIQYPALLNGYLRSCCRDHPAKRGRPGGQLATHHYGPRRAPELRPSGRPFFEAANSVFCSVRFRTRMSIDGRQGPTSLGRALVYPAQNNESPDARSLDCEVLSTPLIHIGFPASNPKAARR